MEYNEKINDMLDFLEKENDKTSDTEIAETFGFWGEADDSCS